MYSALLLPVREPLMRFEERAYREQSPTRSRRSVGQRSHRELLTGIVDPEMRLSHRRR